MGRREIRRTIIENRCRQVVALENELHNINDEIWRLGYIRLDKPIRDGWYRTYVLRDDIQRHKDVVVFQEILDSVIVKVKGREKKYADKAWDNTFREPWYSYQRPGIRYLLDKDYKELSIKAKRYFRSIQVKTYRGHSLKYYCMLPKYYFKQSYERAYITRRKILAPDLERRKQELSEILIQHELYRYSVYNCWNNRLYFNPHRRNRRRAKAALSTMDMDRIHCLPVKRVTEC